MPDITHVIKRSGARVPFKAERIQNAIYRAAVAVGGRDQDTAADLTTQIMHILAENCADGHTPHIEEIQDIVERVLIKNGHSKVAKAYILYRNESAKRRETSSKKAAEPSEFIPWAKIWHILDWAASRDLHTIEKMNARIRNGDFPHIVHEAENLYEDNVAHAAEMILEKKDTLKMVFVTGPSSSGKTTTTFKLAQRLEEKGFSFVPLIVDNYFYDLELHPKDEFGDYDFETPQALDLDLINDHLVKLCKGEEILVPDYDFKKSRRTEKTTPLHLEPHQILLIDSLHGLYPDMSRDVLDEFKFKLYLEPLLQLKTADGRYVRWTDIRLIRRMLRDAAHRSYNPQKTLEHWHYVRSSEKRNIIPYNTTADYIIASGMPYELCFYAARMREQFALWEKEYDGDPLREDAYTRAKRVHAVLQEVIPVHDESAVPGTSVLREFIGGSTLVY